MAIPTMNQEELAKQWIDRLDDGRGLEGAWRLQLIDQRSRVLGTCSDDGWLVDEEGANYVDLDGYAIAPVVDGEPAPETAVRAIDSTRPVRIRRFAKGIPSSCVDVAIKHLLERAPYKGIVFNGTPIVGAYIPIRTWWEREDDDRVDRGQYRDNVYTLFQDLREKDHPDEVLLDPASCTCSETSTMRYEYEAFSVESAECLGQGYSTSIQSVSRNEDGTYDYAVVTRHALTRISGQTTLKCDEFETVTEQTWANLYGGPGAWTDQDGTEVVVPEPCEDTGSGVLVEVSPRQNDDCTYDVTVRTTTATRKLREHETSATAFAKDVRDRTDGVPASEAPSDVTDVEDDGEHQVLARRRDPRVVEAATAGGLLVRDEHVAGLARARVEVR